MRYEVVIIGHDGLERVITTTRRENGAINERDIAAMSEYRIKRKHNEDGSGRVVMGADEHDPNAIVIVYFDATHDLATTVTYRRLPGSDT